MLNTVSSREFNQYPSQTQKKAAKSPVFITTRGKPSYVLISYAEYRKLTGKPQSALEALTANAELAAKLESIDFEIPPRSTAQRPPVDFGED
ncbi:TPA: type II toxin-antitoxin system prevent-host-death family antitoxin [Neisseria meningitidis]